MRLVSSASRTRSRRNLLISSLTVLYAWIVRSAAMQFGFSPRAELRKQVAHGGSPSVILSNTYRTEVASITSRSVSLVITSADLDLFLANRRSHERNPSPNRG